MTSVTPGRVEGTNPSVRPPAEALTFSGVSKHYGLGGSNSFTALEDVTFSVQNGRFTTLIGPSGCGKTTLLRMAAGLIAPTTGEIESDGERVSGVNTRVGYITQESNLFPWLTAIENVSYPLKVHGVGRKERREKARQWVERVGLTGFEDYYPYQLSGGMQKRTSIARSLVYERGTVLMDEPFGPLDAQTRMVLQDELLRLWHQRSMAVLFITHDLVEAIALSDTIILMGKNPGHIKRSWSVPIPRPRDVYKIHASPQFRELYDEIWRYFQPDVVGA